MTDLPQWAVEKAKQCVTIVSPDIVEAMAAGGEKGDLPKLLGSIARALAEAAPVEERKVVVIVQSRYEPRPLWWRRWRDSFAILWVRPKDFGFGIHWLNGGVSVMVWPLTFALVWNVEKRLADDGPEMVAHNAAPEGE